MRAHLVVSDLSLTSLDTTVGVSNLLFGGVDVAVTVVQVTQLILSVKLTPNTVWSRSWGWSWSWSWSLIGHHGVRCVREGVVRGIVVAKVSVVSVLWLIVRLVVLVARVAGVARVARVEEASPDLLSTGGRQQAAHHNLQGDGPD